MRFLFLLLPNLYDIFTLMMIGYAFMLHQKGELQVPFGIACALIYAATRLGIFAGKILHMILGKPQTEEVDEQEAGGKRFIFDFGPQIICVIAFQVIMMITSLPHAATPAKADNIAEQDKQKIEQVEQKKDEVASKDDMVVVEDSTQAKSEYEELFSGNDEESNAAPVKEESNVKPAVKSVAYTSTKKYTPVAKANYSKSQVVVTEVKEEPKPAAAPVVQKRPVYIPETTLNVAGVSAAELNINNARNAVTTVNTVNTVNNTRNTQNTIISAATGASANGLTPKRYPGDDNPIPTAWGYYRQLQQEQQQYQQSKPANTQQQTQQDNSRTIPANTLRTIGY